MRDEYVRAIIEGREGVFYKSWTWQKKRLEILERDNRECQVCKTQGRVGPGEVVHHIQELKDRPDLGVDSDNLMTVCHACHNDIHKTGKGEEPKILIKERW